MVRSSPPARSETAKPTASRRRPPGRRAASPGTLLAGTALSEGGEEGPRGWLKDRYGLSWQITPARLTEPLNDPDEAAAQRVMSAMLQMTKIDIAELERAYAAGA